MTTLRSYLPRELSQLSQQRGLQGATAATVAAGGYSGSDAGELLLLPVQLLRGSNGWVGALSR